MSVEIIETAAGPVSFERVGDGPDLVLLHSLLSDRHVFDQVVSRLAGRRRVNVVDLPGFGDTRLVEPGIDNYADLIGDLLVAGGFDPDTTGLLGNGLGAFVALGTAIRHGDRFDRLTLVGCGAAFPEEGKQAFRAMVDRVREGGMDAIVEQAVRRIFTEDFIDAHPEMADDRRIVLGKTDPRAFEAACLSLIDLDYREAAAGVANPTLVVVGSHDEATPPGLGRDLADRIPGAAFVELPGIAHAPQLQDPGGFFDAIAGFLEAR